MSDRTLIVGVCTFQRQSVVETIRSLFTQTKKPDLIIVVDNDAIPSAKAEVLALRAESDIPLRYHHVRGGNIAIARNAVLDRANGSLLAFIDDDEVADPLWLRRLDEALTEERAAIFGPQLAKYDPDAPAWMQVLSPHSFRGHTIDGKLQAGSTGNCLINLAHQAIASRRFDEERGPYGGTDTQFFVESYQDGARYFFAKDAVITENVPPDRANWKWLLRRRYRYGHTYARVTGKRGPKDAAIASAKILYCGGAALLRAFNPVAGRAAILRGMLHVGVVAATLGMSSSPEYTGNEKG